MNKFSCYTSRAGNALFGQLQHTWRIMLVVMAAFLLSGTAFAQTPAHPTCPKPNGVPSPPHCVSQDLQVIGAFLESSQCACTTGDVITANLTMKLSNKTGSERTSFAFFAVLVKTNPDQTTESVYVKACTSPVLPGSISEVTFPDAITYTCGQTLALTDVYLAWTDASDGDRRQCDGPTGILANFCTIDPKCGRAANIAITPLLTAYVDDTDGTCVGEMDGSITVVANGGVAPYTYTLNPGNVTNSTGVFTGLAAGNYTVTVKDSDDPQCQITVNATVDAYALPDKPTLSATQPSCTVPTGTITITSPTTGLTFSVNGGAFAAYPSTGYIDLPPGNYSIVAKNANGCESEPATITIDDAPIVPSGISLDVDQPTCEVLYGRIEFLAPLGAYTYSIDGGANYQASPVFENVEPGMTYTLSVRSNDGCVTAAGTVEIDDAPIVPSGISLNVVQPTCELLSGTITVTSPTGAYTYSIDGTNYQASAVFPGLAPGNYTIYVKSNDGCVTASSPATIDPLPVCEVFAGCTLGYWKNHPGSWCDDYDTSDLYGVVFGLPTSNPYYNTTLIDALNTKGGGYENLLRQSVAALLNACHEHVYYELTEAQIIAMVQQAMASRSAAGNLATYLDGLNNAGCTIDAHNRPISMTVSTSLSSIDVTDELTAYPMPFSDKATIEFRIAATENYVVNLYDSKGGLVKQLKAGIAQAGELQQVEVDGRNLSEGLYIARMVSDSGAKSVKLILKR